MASCECTVRRAEIGEADAVCKLVCKAYQGYVAEMGAEPAPMTQDYADLIAQGKVTVASVGDRIAGVLVAYTRREGFHVENVAVAPGHQGSGFGERLMQEAECMAQRLGRSRVDLYTNAIMAGNVPFYEKLGYTQLGRSVQDGYDRIFFSKAIS